MLNVDARNKKAKTIFNAIPSAILLDQKSGFKFRDCPVAITAEGPITSVTK